MDANKEKFVLACKSRDPNKEVLKVYGEVYYLGDQDPSRHITVILGDICDKYQLFNTKDLISCLDPDTDWQYGIDECDSFHKKVVKVLTTKIRLTTMSKFRD